MSPAFIQPPQLARRKRRQLGKRVTKMPMRSGRLEKRTRLAIPVRISSLLDPAIIERTTTENISPLGVRVVVSHHREMNERLVLNSPDGNLQTQARVVYCQPLSDGQFALGLQFPQETSVWVKKKLGFEN